MSAPATTRRRTQQERRAATRRAVLDAALEVLQDQGYANLSTTAVAATAGLSQGAMYRYFATRTELVAAMVEDLFATMTNEFTSAVLPTGDVSTRIDAALTMLEATFTDPRLAAAYDVYTVARTDPELGARLQPVVAAHTASILAVAQRLFAEVAEVESQAFVTFVELAMFALQGMAFGRIVDPDDPARARLLGELRRLAHAQLD